MIFVRKEKEISDAWEVSYSGGLTSLTTSAENNQLRLQNVTNDVIVYKCQLMLALDLFYQ